MNIHKFVCYFLGHCPIPTGRYAPAHKAHGALLEHQCTTCKTFLVTEDKPMEPRERTKQDKDALDRKEIWDTMQKAGMRPSQQDVDTFMQNILHNQYGKQQAPKHTPIGQASSNTSC